MNDLLFLNKYKVYFILKKRVINYCKSIILNISYAHNSKLLQFWFSNINTLINKKNDNNQHLKSTES
jgi:hypothetical protein